MLQKLKESVELKFGKKISYQRDCKLLSERIISETSLYISPSTLRRFFGFLSTNSQPSHASLDILSQYCGNKNWDDFIWANTQSHQSDDFHIEHWEMARLKADTISKKTCDSIKKQTPINFTNTAFRSFAEERLSYFLKSNHIATPFVGPGGYGKSTLLAGWYSNFSSLPQNKNNIILFLSGSVLESHVNVGSFFENWIVSLLQIDIATNFFDQINNNSKAIPGKFILIIDALDELGDGGNKSEKIFAAIHKFLLQSNSQPQWFKLILSSRHATWQHFYRQSISPELWYFAEKENFNSADANMPALNNNEIQIILDNTINKEASVRIVVEELPNDLLHIISYPYYVQLFIKIFNPETAQHINDRLDLLNLFLNKELHQSQFSDEKFDILNKIIELSVSNNTPGTAVKNVLKELYPIHLKLAGNYFNAYNQLLSYGLLTEELVENRFGAYTKQVRITQWAIYELLLIQMMIQKNNGISSFLFIKIELDFAESPLLPSLICLLFEIAYKNKNIETLKPFFKLNDKTLSLVFSLPTIPQTLRKDDFMRNELIPHYASDRKARKYLFEGVIDFNSIATSWKYLIYSYLQKSTNKKELFYAQTLLCASGLLMLDLSWEIRFQKEFPNPLPHPDVKPYVQGLWFSCKIICTMLSDTSSVDTIINQIETFATEQQAKWDESQMNEFDFGLIFGILVTKRSDFLLKRLKRFEKPRSKENLVSIEKALILFNEHAKWRQTSEFNPEKMQEIEGYLCDMPQWNSYLPILIGKSWLAMYFLSLGKAESAYDLFRKSIEISNLAGYLIFEVKLLKNLNSILLSLGEHKKAAECETFAKGLVEKKGNIFDLL
jgi:hypothetical protein